MKTYRKVDIFIGITVCFAIVSLFICFIIGMYNRSQQSESPQINAQPFGWGKLVSKPFPICVDGVQQTDIMKFEFKMTEGDKQKSAIIQTKWRPSMVSTSDWKIGDEVYIVCFGANFGDGSYTVPTYLAIDHRSTDRNSEKVSK